jgi:hypothetical protein
MDDTTPSPSAPSPADFPPIRSQADLEHLWRTLVGPSAFARRSVWFTILDAEQRSTPALVQIDELPQAPGDRGLDNLVEVCEHLIEPGGSVAFLLTRPGRGGMTADDRAWARALTAAVRRAGLPAWPVHRANRDELVVCSPDDLAA